MTEQDVAATVRALNALSRRERSEVILAAFSRQTWKQRSRVDLGLWFCDGKGQSCPLLIVWQSPLGRLGMVPDYTLSLPLNERESSAAGRRASTKDGVNHWIGDGLLVDSLPAGTNLTLTCKHHRGLLDVDDILAALDGVRPGAPVRRVVLRAARDSG